MIMKKQRASRLFLDMGSWACGVDGGEFCKLLISHQIFSDIDIPRSMTFANIGCSHSTATMPDTDKVKTDTEGDKPLEDSDEEEIFYDARFSAEEEAVRATLLSASVYILQTD